jgi:hypothetical protein
MCGMACSTDADGKGVWAWHPWAGVKPCERRFREATVTNKVMDTGASTQEPVNTIAQGMSVQRLNLW